jgi:hypothetical protein
MSKVERVLPILSVMLFLLLLSVPANSALATLDRVVLDVPCSVAEGQTVKVQAVVWTSRSG